MLAVSDSDKSNDAGFRSRRGRSSNGATREVLRRPDVIRLWTCVLMKGS